VRSAKRILDVTIAATTLVTTAPLLAMISIAIKLDSPGPVIFRQERVGRRRTRIQTLKLRTMRADPSGPAVTAAGDRRITRVGRILRITKLDELPQLWNVLRGEMSIVGPRPEVARYTDHYGPELEDLFAVRPGLTDLASIVFRDEERLLAVANDRERAYQEIIMPLKLAIALDGVRRSTLRHDLLVMLRTAAAIVGIRSDKDRILIAEALRRIELLNGAGPS
jgi:lipopolysaccharide/colanic/teichoic acid biosynthesis glycosyltransferase